MDSFVTVRQLLPGDLAEFREMLGVFVEAFEMRGLKIPGESHLGTLLARKDFIVLVAMTPDAVIGGLTAHVLSSCYTESPEVYLYDLAVKSSVRRNGVGRLLIEALADYCRTHGIGTFFVQADVGDVHALNFYRAMGGIPGEVVHYVFPLDK